MWHFRLIALIGYLFSGVYILQESRMGGGNKIRTLGKFGEINSYF